MKKTILMALAAAVIFHSGTAMASSYCRDNAPCYEANYACCGGYYGGRGGYGCGGGRYCYENYNNNEK